MKIIKRKIEKKKKKMDYFARKKIIQPHYVFPFGGNYAALSTHVVRKKRGKRGNSKEA